MFKITKTQVLHILSMIVFVPAAGVISAWATKTIPGVHFTPTQISQEMYVVTGSALTIALHYLHGNLWFEKNVAPIVDVNAKK